MKTDRKIVDLLNDLANHNYNYRSGHDSWADFCKQVEMLRFVPDEGDEDLNSKFLAIRCGKDIHGISINTKGQITFHNHPKIKDEATMWTMAHPILSSHDEKRMKNCLLLYRLVKNPKDFVRYLGDQWNGSVRNQDWNQDLYNKVDGNVREFLKARVRLTELKKSLFNPEKVGSKVDEIISKQVKAIFHMPERKYTHDGRVANPEEMEKTNPCENTWPKAIFNKCRVIHAPAQTENFIVSYEKDVVHHRRRGWNKPSKPDTEYISDIRVSYSTKNWYRLYKKGLNTFNGFLVLEYIREARPGYHMVNVATPAKNRTLHVKTALVNPTYGTMSWVSNVEAPRIRVANK